MGNWFGVLAPAATAPEIVTALNVEIGKILAGAALRERFATQGIEPRPSTPEQLVPTIRSELERLAQVLQGRRHQARNSTHSNQNRQNGQRSSKMPAYSRSKHRRHAHGDRINE